MAGKKKGPISSREAGDEGKSKDEAAKAPTEPPDPPAPGETITEEASAAPEPSARQKSIAAASKKLAPSAETDSAQERHRKRRDKKSAHSKTIEREGLQRGDLSSIPEVTTWRIQSDKRVSIGQRPVLLRAGQVVTSLTHDLDLIRRQGAVLERVS